MSDEPVLENIIDNKAIGPYGQVLETKKSNKKKEVNVKKSPVQNPACPNEYDIFGDCIEKLY